MQACRWYPGFHCQRHYQLRSFPGYQRTGYSCCVLRPRQGGTGFSRSSGGRFQRRICRYAGTACHRDTNGSPIYQGLRIWMCSTTVMLGYKAALKANRIPFDPQLVVEGYVSIASGQKATEMLCALPLRRMRSLPWKILPPSAPLKQLKAMGKLVPQDVGVVGFANEMFGEHITPSLTTFDQQTGNDGKRSYRFVTAVAGPQRCNHHPAKDHAGTYSRDP